MASEGLHESPESLSDATKDMHRAIVSLMEELEAIDWYQQRAEACTDPALRAVLVHNKNEEIEHAMMGLEWIRRQSPEFDQNARTYLFTEAPITEVEKGETAGGGGEGKSDRGKGAGGKEKAKASSAAGGSALGLGIGSLRKKI